MRWLDEEIKKYAEKDIYPFHMPGTKRKNTGLKDPYIYDITEIDGFDDLRRSEGILGELQQEWAKLYGAGQAYLSVNGSTCGNLAMIFAATKPGDSILVAGQSHWSIHNAAELRGLNVIEPSQEEKTGVPPESITPEELREILNLHPGIRAVVITSPTYEGMVSDVEEIARIVHAHHACLLVDSAHGAHLGLPVWQEGSIMGRFENPVQQGADAVVVSLHKTLPVLGQTSLILLPERNGDSASRKKQGDNGFREKQGDNGFQEKQGDNGFQEKQTVLRDLETEASWEPLAPEAVKRYLNMFQTSSPSYVLMSSVAAGCRLLEENGRQLAMTFEENLKWFYGQTEDLKYYRVINNDNHDMSKIVISTNFSEPSKGALLKNRAGLPGEASMPERVRLPGMDLMARLRSDHRIEMEKATENYVLAITTLMDTREGFARLAEALRQLDEGVI